MTDDLAVRPEPARATPGTTAVGLSLGAILAATAGAWLWTRTRQQALAVRTAERLAPKYPARIVPNAADIHVG